MDGNAHDVGRDLASDDLPKYAVSTVVALHRSDGCFRHLVRHLKIWILAGRSSANRNNTWDCSEECNSQHAELPSQRNCANFPRDKPLLPARATAARTGP